MKKILFIVLAFFAMQFTHAQAPLSSIIPIPFEIVENQPIFPGGNNEFIKFVGKNFKTPDDENFTGGLLKVTFVIETDGTISDVKILKDIGYGSVAEIKRVLSLCPKWTPGIQNDKPVRVIYTLPVNIRV
ncbi:hypothetical protein EQG63_05420 [Flavobacterium amnicola]|uniref:TonB C-terminal domain-containing protein n=1 Tax=Flavobacterium amnicola TaxID=2506422 RepID=A0A4Q1K702_9FLAO|nr:energy transducer TonB [Flavobacterium amnicola]RXR21382.1 hypothetical protein EQG63_05420 [Flavobacterium amnicola]